MVDSFFVNPAKRSRKRTAQPTPAPRPPKRRAGGAEPTSASVPDPNDDEITSDSDENSDNAVDLSDLSDSEDEEKRRDQQEDEADKRRRLAKEYLHNLEQEALDANAFDAADLDREIISRRLVQDVAETQGKVFRHLGTGSFTVSKVGVCRSQARHLTAIAALWPYAYTVSKDGVLQKWEVTDSRPKLVKMIRCRGRTGNASAGFSHSDEVVAVAVSSKYVVTGGRDRKFVVRNAETLDPVRAFTVPDRHGGVLCMTFRRGTNELYVGGADLRLHIYDLTQMAFVETLYGHQDGVVDVAALGQERCVTVGQRDRTAIFWKIPEESRLMFRGGDTKLASQSADALKAQKDLVLEGSIDCCTMLDNQLFVTGSDNGNVSLWSTGRKKPVFIHANAHGRDPPLPANRASAESDPARAEIPPALPRYITAISAIPYSDTFFTGSSTGTVNMWQLSDDQRRFDLVREIRIGKGIVTALDVAEEKSTERGKTHTFKVVVTLAREPRLGRWIRVSGHDTVAVFSIEGTY